MSWKRLRVYRCDVCGCRKPAEFRGYEYEVPSGWTHSGWRNGTTICPRCLEAMSEIKCRNGRADA